MCFYSPKGISDPNVGVDDLTVESLFEMSFEELLSLKVSVASTKPEAISNTPAIVSTYRMDELMRQGVRSLEQAISVIPGIVVDEGTFGNATIMIRGITETFGSKVLFLLDGVPYWSPSHNSIPTLSIPIEAIEKIEVIRGPGAVIYGTNAISGVINVITRINPGGKGAITFGSDNHLNMGGSFAKKLDNGARVAFSFEHQQQDGYAGEYRFENIRLTMPKQKEVSSAMARYNDKNLNLMFHLFEEKVQGRNPPSFVNFSPLYDIPLFVTNEGYLVHGDYQWQFDSSYLKVYADYSKYALKFDQGFTIAAFDNDGNDNNRWRAGLQFSYDFETVEGLSLLTGGEFEERKIRAYRAFSPSDLSTPNLTVIEADSTDELSSE
jgi:outer membrane receptor protein involved in Fe transport